jgi:hypothetical protein
MVPGGEETGARSSDYAGRGREVPGPLGIKTQPPIHNSCRKQLEKVRNERGTVTDAWLNVVMRLLEEVAPRLVLVVATVSRLDLQTDQGPRALSSPLVSFTAATALIWLVVLFSWGLQRHFAERGRGRAWRLYRVLMSALVAAVLLAYSVAAGAYEKGLGGMWRWRFREGQAW